MSKEIENEAARDLVSDELRERLISQERESRQLRQRLRRIERGLSAMVVGAGTIIAGYALLNSSVALAAGEMLGCDTSLPFCFSAGQPASAAQVNSNFKYLSQWLGRAIFEIQGLVSREIADAKVAAANDASEQINSVVRNGELSVDGSGIYKSEATGGDLGLYSYAEGSPLQLMTNGGNVRISADNGATTTAQIDSYGNVSARGDYYVSRSAGNRVVDYELVPWNFCMVVSPNRGTDLASSCPAGWQYGRVQFSNIEARYNVNVGHELNDKSFELGFCCRIF